MKAISLWQPWASLWLTESKIHETRTWPYPKHGMLAVHAAKNIARDFPDRTRGIVERHFGLDWEKRLPRGAIIGVVEIIDCLKVAEVYPTGEGEMPDDFWCGNFTGERFAWRRRRALVLPKPIEFRGRQNIFSVPDDIAPALNWDGKQ